MNVRKELFKNQDLEYKAFNARLVPTVSPDKIIGVRVPIMRDIAKRAVKENADMTDNPDSLYYEEIMVKGFMIGYSKSDLPTYLSKLTDFVPLIDNWAVCDCVASTLKFAKKYQQEVWTFLLPFIDGSEYDVRFAVVMMMDYFINDNYIDAVLDIYKNVHSDKYYINMAVSWGLQVAFVKYPKKVMPLIENAILDNEIHNRTIQKICDSYRVDKGTKDYLKTLKRHL